MYEFDKEMSLSIEDLVMVIACLVVFVLTFTDIRSADPITFASLPAILILLVSWGIVRFRRRPLPKQVHYKRQIYLSSVKVFRNFHIITIIFQYLFLLFRYPASLLDDSWIGLIFNFVALFVISIFEFAGNVFVGDYFEVMIKMEGEDEQLFRKKRFNLLFGTRFYVIITLFSIISLGITYLPIRSIVDTQDVLLIVMQFVALLIAIAMYLFVYYKTMAFEKIKDGSLLLKAIDYYESADLTEEAFSLLEEYVKEDTTNVTLLSRLALMHNKEGNYDESMKYAGLVLAEIEEKQIQAPYMTARAHFFRAISLYSKKKYQEAYDEVTQTLKYTPEFNPARKLEGTLEKQIKAKDQE